MSDIAAEDPSQLPDARKNSDYPTLNGQPKRPEVDDGWDSGWDNDGDIIPDATEEDVNYHQWLHSHLERPKREIRIPMEDEEIDEFARKAKEMTEKLIKQGYKRETAMDLSLLVLYDIVMLVDDSTTMKHEDKGKRIDTLKMVLREACDVYELANPAGFKSVKFLNCSQGRKDVTKEKLAFLDGHQWLGLTRIGTALKAKVLDNFVFHKQKPMTKPLLVIIITDGEVEGERDGLLEHVVKKCIQALEKNTKKGPGAVAFQFAQVGNDAGARNLLKRLDNDEEVKEHVDCLRYSKLEDIRDEELKKTVLPKLLVGALLEHWDQEAPECGVTGGLLTANAITEEDYDKEDI